MPNYFALLPAAGYGSRMGQHTPKQYLTLAGKPMIYHAIRAFFQSTHIKRIIVVLSPQDPEWAKHDWQTFSEKLTVLYCGGETRADSVFNGLNTAAEQCAIDADDWILVHDAARPLLTQQALNQLIETLIDDSVGGLLAVPVADTLKRGSPDARVIQTESREQLWQAQTPQMFRRAMLLKALRMVEKSNITDDASAIEAMGHHPKLVHCIDDNFKVTYPQDLALAELILHNRNKP